MLSEVKGVRLFVKRGNSPFGGAMLGTLRHLVNKSTQDERLREFSFVIRCLRMNLMVLFFLRQYSGGSPFGSRR